MVPLGQHLCRKDQPSHEMVVLLAGSAVILDEAPASVRAGHGEPVKPLYHCAAGATFGERCVVGLDDHHHLTVRALTNCDVYGA